MEVETLTEPLMFSFQVWRRGSYDCYIQVGTKSEYRKKKALVVDSKTAHVDFAKEKQNGQS
jgi:hypothetical protein